MVHGGLIENLDLEDFGFFNPVENISLLPYLTAIALHHTLIIWQKNNKTTNWLIFLSVLNFLLIILGMLLVRSGLLMSVHAFAFAKEKAQWLLVSFLILFIPSIGLVFRYIFFSNKLLVTDKHNVHIVNSVELQYYGTRNEHYSSSRVMKSRRTQIQIN